MTTPVADMQYGPSAGTPVVSVCIANFNGRDLLDDCITSIRAQDADVAIEILVHDDASTDDSVAYLEARHPDVRVIASESNVGFCIANNRMVEAALGQYVLLLNNDAALFPDAITALLGRASMHPLEILTLPQYDWLTGDLVDRGCVLDLLHVPVPVHEARDLPVAYIIGACLWIRREDWKLLGGFPEWMESIGEDLFLCAAARLQGFQVRALEQSGYRHRQGASFGGNRMGTQGLASTTRRRRLSERNRAAVVVTCTPGLLWLPWTLLHLTCLAAEGLVIALVTRKMSVWHEIYLATFHWLWSNRRLLTVERQQLQACRVVGLRAYLRGRYECRLRKIELLAGSGMPRID